MPIPRIDSGGRLVQGDPLLAAAPSRGLILDPFAGSGPALIAAERTNRTCFAVELEPRYCDIVVARWEALTGSAAERLGQ